MLKCSLVKTGEKKKYSHKTRKRIREIQRKRRRGHTMKLEPSVLPPPVSRNGESKYPSYPQRFLPDQRHHNGNPDEKHMQLLSLNKISKFQLYPGTMATALVCWLSSYSVGLLIVLSPLPCATWVSIPQLYSYHTVHFYSWFISSSPRSHHP